jgi:PAS domain S-box-containing protein
MVNKRRPVRDDLARLRELFAELASNLAGTIGRLRSHRVDDASHEVRTLQLRGERQRVEDALRSSETRLRLVIDTIPAVAWGALPDGSCAFVNQRWTEYTGMTAEDAAGWGWLTAFHHDDVGTHMEKWRASLASAQPFENEARLRRAANGEYRWFLIQGAPLRDELGKVVRWYGTATEIEGRKRAEQALRRSEAYLADAQRMSHTGSWALDVTSRRIIHSSEEHHRLFGFDPAAAMPPWDDWVGRIHPDDRDRTMATIEGKIRERSDFEVDCRTVHPDGTIKHIHAVGHPVLSPSGDLVEFVGTSIDVTERERAQRAESLNSQVFESAPDGICIVGRDYRYRRSNPVYARRWGIAVEQIVGTHVSELLGLDAFHRTIKPNLDRCFAGEEVTFEWFSEFRGRLHLAVSYSPLRSGSEEVEAALVIQRDFTEYMRASEALREAQMELAHVNRVTTMGQLAASIAHEIKQPLTGVVANADAGLRWLARQPPNVKEAQDALDCIVKDGHRAGDVISRIGALIKKAPPQKEGLEINEAILEVIALARGEMVKNGISVQTQLAEGLPLIQGDRVQLQQVILNLIVNAVDAMSGVSEGTRELFIGTADDAQNGVLIEVRDSGPGLPPESLERVFDAFYTTKAAGMGMGLSICRSIIEAHGGRIWASRAAGPGATVQFTLPVA